MNNVTDEHQGLRTAVAPTAALNTALTASADRKFSEAWSPAGATFFNLQDFCSGIATVMPTTSRVEGDFSLMNWRRNDYCANFTDYSLEGCLHAKQFKALQNVVRSE